MNAEYICRIEITHLWGLHDISWKLRPDVNILSGVNGIGKSTLINLLTATLASKGTYHSELTGATVHLSYMPEGADSIAFDVIRSFDRPLLSGETVGRLSDHNVKTELDWQLYRLQRRYLDYQVNVSNRIIDYLQDSSPEAREKALDAGRPRRTFQDTIDRLFRETGKRLDRGHNEIAFTLPGGQRLTPYQLSSGEKQLLVILLTVLIQDGKPYTLLMDEPEISLHIDWQQQLIGCIRELNPKAQIILATHSPALIMDGWLDAVTEMSDITRSDDSQPTPQAPARS